MKEMTVKVGGKMPSIPEGWEIVLFGKAKLGDMVYSFNESGYRLLDEKEIELDWYSFLLRKKPDPLLEWANSNPKFAALVELGVMSADPGKDPLLGWFVPIGMEGVLFLGVPPDGVKAAKLKYDTELKSWVRD